MIYGNVYFKNEVDLTDRIGIRTLVLSKYWQASRWPLTIEEQDAETPEPPPIPGGMLFIGRQTRPAPGGYKTFYSFEGVNGDGKTVTFKTRANSIDYEYQPGFEQIDIRQHRLIRQLIEKYGGVPDPGSLQIIWPITTPAVNTTSRGLGGAQTEEERNPMFGRDTFFAATGIYTFRYASFEPPSHSITNKIFKSASLPGKAPREVDGDFLGAPSPYKRVGAVHDITEIYYLSPPGGWPTPIYQLASGGNNIDSGSNGVIGPRNP